MYIFLIYLSGLLMNTLDCPLNRKLYVSIRSISCTAASCSTAALSAAQVLFRSLIKYFYCYRFPADHDSGGVRQRDAPSSTRRHRHASGRIFGGADQQRPAGIRKDGAKRSPGVTSQLRYHKSLARQTGRLILYIYKKSS